MLAVRFRLGGLAHMLVMLGKVTLAVLVQGGLLLGKVALAVVVQGRLLPMLLVLGMLVLLIMGQACLLWAGWCSILGVLGVSGVSRVGVRPAVGLSRACCAMEAYKLLSSAGGIKYFAIAVRYVGLRCS